MSDDYKLHSRQSFIFLAIGVGDERSEVRRRADGVTQFVEQAAARFSLPVVRADRIVTSGQITSQIIQSLAEARLVIADISEHNPNVMYELGIAHSLQRPVIIIVDRGTTADVPFDIAVTRVIFYETSLPEIVDFEEKLTEAIRYVLSDNGADSTSISPVQVALDAGRDRQSLITSTEDFSPTERILATLGDIRERMASIEGRMAELESRRPASEDDESVSTYSRKVFIVHGHDDGLKLELRDFLSHLDFEPIILHERPDGGKTIYSKLLGEANDVGYAFILLTPDDRGGEATSDALMPRARQNVVFEHGLFAGYLSPERVCAIVRGSVEIPSDLNGVIYKHVPDGASLTAIALDIARELRAAGYILDMNKLP